MRQDGSAGRTNSKSVRQTRQEGGIDTEEDGNRNTDGRNRHILRRAKQTRRWEDRQTDRRLDQTGRGWTAGQTDWKMRNTDGRVALTDRRDGQTYRRDRQTDRQTYLRGGVWALGRRGPCFLRPLADSVVAGRSESGAAPPVFLFSSRFFCFCFSHCSCTSCQQSRSYDVKVIRKCRDVLTYVSHPFPTSVTQF